MFCSQCGRPVADGITVCNACIAKAQSHADAADYTPFPVEPEQPHQPYQKIPYPQTRPNPQSTTIKPENPARMPKIKSSRNPPAPPSAGKKVGTVILCIFMVLFLAISSLLGAVRALCTEDALEDILDEIQFGTLAFTDADGEEKTLADAINECVLQQTSDYFSSAADEIPYSQYVPDYVKDNVTEYATQYVTDHTEVDDEDIEDIFELDEVREFIIDAILEYTDCILYGKRLHPVTAEQIAAFICSNQELIRDEIDNPIYFDYDEMVRQMNRYFDFTTIESKSAIERFLGLDLSPITFIFSALYYILLALTVIIFALIIVLNFKNLSACLTKVGMSFIVYAALMLLPGIVLLLSGSIFSDLAFLSVITSVCLYIAPCLLLPCATALVLGIFLILARKFWLKPRLEA